MNRAYRFRRAAAAGALISLLSLAGCSSTPTAETPRQSDLALYRRVMERVESSYVEPVSEDRLVKESLKGMLRFLRDGTVWNGRDETHLKLYSRRDLAHALARRFEVRQIYGYYLIERRHAPLPGTYTITTNPLLANLCFILVAVATSKRA